MDDDLIFFFTYAIIDSHKIFVISLTYIINKRFLAVSGRKPINQ